MQGLRREFERASQVFMHEEDPLPILFEKLPPRPQQPPQPPGLSDGALPDEDVDQALE